MSTKSLFNDLSLVKISGVKVMHDLWGINEFLSELFTGIILTEFCMRGLHVMLLCPHEFPKIPAQKTAFLMIINEVTYMHLP